MGPAVRGSKAVVLSSAGIDSTTTLAIAKEEGYEIYSLTFFYGQRHALELEAAKRVAKVLGAKEHLVVHIDSYTFNVRDCLSEYRELFDNKALVNYLRNFLKPWN